MKALTHCAWAALALSLALPAGAVPPGATKVSSSRTMHSDTTYTDTVKDLYKHEMTETIYNGRDIVIARKKFLLNENGDPTQGAIYDGAENVIARVQFFFDELARVTEERCTNNQGEIFQRVIHQYDAGGKPVQPRVYNYPVKAPNMRPAKIDLTQTPPSRATPSKPDGAKSDKSPVRPGQAPQIETVSPGSRVAVPLHADPAPPNLQVPQMQDQTPREEKEKKGSKLNPLNWFKKEK